MAKQPNLDAQTILKRRRYEELVAAGRNAFKEGNRQLAHDLWREAATVDPYDEKIWLSLFRVLDRDEDRIVCLENIIAINPMNVEARRRLRALQDMSDPAFEAPKPIPLSAGTPGRQKQVPEKSRRSKPPKASRAKAASKSTATIKRSGRGLGRAAVIILLAIILGVLVAVALTIILTPV